MLVYEGGRNLLSGQQSLSSKYTKHFKKRDNEGNRKSRQIYNFILIIHNWRF